ncbi:unnamed protein product [Rotaria socialis]
MYVPCDVSSPPRFVVNLDMPPALRWQHIVRLLYADQLHEVEKKIESMVDEIFGQYIGPMLEKVLSTIMVGITRLGLVYYGQELKGLSNDTGIPLGRLVMMQFVYECFACCTSFVCQDEQTNIPMHIRTMDWEFDFLKPLTIGPMLEKVLSTIMVGITRLGLVYYGQELKGLSNDTGIPLGRLVMMQFVYECFACCTSIVCQDQQTNIPMHIRTMDWELDFLKPLTIDVDFQENDQTVFKATTWIGYVGILTGMRVQNGYSVSVNFRHAGGQLTTNLKTA